MKNIYIIILILFQFAFVGCSSLQTKGYPKSAYISFKRISELNRLIDKSQRESLSHSPFEGSTFLDRHLNIQMPFREQYIKDLEDLLTKFSSDTIFLVESYSEMCINCRADYIAIYKDNLLITYRDKSYDSKYTREQEFLTENFIDTKDYRHEDILELKSEIRYNNPLWNRQPEKYGTDKVLGGGYTFYSVIYPHRKVGSMYIRAWIPQYRRK